MMRLFGAAAVLAVVSGQTYNNDCEATSSERLLEYCCKNRDGSPRQGENEPCARADLIPASRRCDGVNDCPGASGQVRVTADGVSIADDEIGCGSLADEIIQNRVEGIRMVGGDITPPATRPGSTAFEHIPVDNTCDDGQEEGETCFPNAPPNSNGVFVEGQVNEPMQWQFASSGSSTYTWSYKTAREQGLPDAPSQPNGAVCNFYKDNPYTEGQFKIALQESNNAPVVTHTLAAVDGSMSCSQVSEADGICLQYSPSATNGAVLTESYTDRYGGPAPVLCEGAQLTACMDETLEYDTETCVCASYKTDTELTADFVFQPPKDFTGTITFHYEVQQYDFCTPPESRAETRITDGNSDQQTERLVNQCGGRNARDTRSCNTDPERGPGCSQHIVNTGFIPVTLVVREHQCVTDEAYCVNGDCQKPGGCLCREGWFGDRCDMERTSGAAATSATFAGLAGLAALLA